ncbi:unnamed protein product [Schistosoma intercalatum]|nr:unnamed protein product [Schistosoma intercalatum]CAH8634660.1 unnamed protein product [Schistosoma intercalatum]
MESNADLEEVQINVNGTNRPHAKSIEQDFSSSIPNHSVSCTEAPAVSLETSNDLSKSPTILSSSTVTKKEIPPDYVFGSNISSRVVNADVSKGASVNLWTSTSTSHDIPRVFCYTS